VLQSIVVRIMVHNATGAELCHGFVAQVRNDTAYVVTAKHCIASMSDIVQTGGPDPALLVTITYANGGAGVARFFYWSPTADVVVIPATFTRRPLSFAGACPTCTYYTIFPPGQVIPILSVLSASGSDPVLSNGALAVSPSGVPTVILPVAPGTSGAPVVDLQGNFVGIVSAVMERGGSSAGILTRIVTAPEVVVAVDSATAKFEARRSAPPPPAPPAPTAHPPLPSPVLSTPDPSLPIRTSGEFVGTVVGIAPRQTRILVASSDTGARTMLTAIPTCPNLREGDQISLHIHDGVAIITAASSSSFRLCSLRVIAEADVTTPFPLPPTGTGARVLHVSEDQTTFTIRTDTTPQPITMTTTKACVGILEGDRVWLDPLGRPDLTAVRVSVPGASCMMRIQEHP
jgi:hypothetical protein